MVPGWSETEFQHLHSLITTIISTDPSTLQETQDQLMTTVTSTPVPFLGTWFDRAKPRQRATKRQIAIKDQAIAQQILADDNCGIAHPKVPTVSLRVGSVQPFAHGKRNKRHADVRAPGYS